MADEWGNPFDPPVVLLHGGGDLVPHAKLVDVSGAGHMVAGDENDLFTEAVVGFLGTEVGRRPR